MHSIFRDPISGLSHFIGAVFAVVALCILSVRAALYGDEWHMLAYTIFGATLLLMFVSSTVYHLVHAPSTVILWLKRIDHIAIFLLIAGTYTPVCLLPLRDAGGLVLITIVWGLAIAGVALKLFWITAPRWLSTVLYVAMGWCIVFIGPSALELVPSGALWWFLYGGLSYSIGAIVYVIKWPNPNEKWFGFHEIWHLFVMGGAFCHFWAVAYHLT